MYRTRRHYLTLLLALALLFVLSAARPADFVRGDADADGVLSVTDAIRVLRYLFTGGPAPECLDAADVNDDGGRRPDITDVVSLLDWLFRGTAAPRPPTPSAAEYAAADCGIDPTPNDAMDCSLSAARCQ